MVSVIKTHLEEIINNNSIDLKKDTVKKEKKKRKNVPSHIRYRVLKNAGFRCQACGAKPTTDNGTTLHVDHIIPFSKDGSCDISNYQALCNSCNIGKGNRDDTDLRIKLINHGTDRT